MTDRLRAPLGWTPPLATPGDPRNPPRTGPWLEIAPLGRLGLVWLQARAPTPGLLEQLEANLGCPLPGTPNTAAGTDPQALWTAPGEWLLVTTPDRAARLTATISTPALATDISDSRAGFVIGGARAVDLLSKGCGLDLHPRAFAAGHCAGTRFAGLPALLHRPGEAPAFRLWVDRGYAAHMWRWLGDAAREFTPATAATDAGSSPAGP